MIFKVNINTEIKLETVEDLEKLRVLMEVNNLEKPNFSELARQLSVDRRTVKKYYDGNTEKIRKKKKSRIDDYYDLISSHPCFQQKTSKYFTINHIYIDI